MSGPRHPVVFLLVSALAIVWGCHAAPPAGEGAPAKGGVFADVIAAVETVKKSMPAAEKRDSDVPRGEWKLILDARERFTVPRVVSESSSEGDYYQPEGTDAAGGADTTQGDALDVILDAEWEEYTTLSNAALSVTADPELVKVARESLTDFYRDLPVLMDAVPDAMRERVLHIVVLRYFNTILRAGVDPRLYMLMEAR
jgi:hypothetical protein